MWHLSAFEWILSRGLLLHFYHLTVFEWIVPRGFLHIFILRKWSASALPWWVLTLFICDEITPRKDAKSYGKIINKAIVDWYLYRTRTHNIESQKNVYVMRMAEGGYLKMRILNYYCSREESECKSIMCSRQEAACYGIEYVLANSNGINFPAPEVAQSPVTQAETPNWKSLS